MSILIFFFFFQAEDGIRDLTVTGVQTCALPISWAIERVRAELAVKQTLAVQEKVKLALCIAKQIAAEDEENCRMIGQHGLNLIEEAARAKNGKPVNILTHCNAGWLAFVDYGSALAPVYAAHDRALRSEELTSELQSQSNVVCRLL